MAKNGASKKIREEADARFKAAKDRWNKRADDLKTQLTSYIDEEARASYMDTAEQATGGLMAGVVDGIDDGWGMSDMVTVPWGVGVGLVGVLAGHGLKERHTLNVSRGVFAGGLALLGSRVTGSLLTDSDA